tara:strand:- start:18143 stop:18949 length:807 start_codon:yes stop_codon:yes gene_type:complete
MAPRTKHKERPRQAELINRFPYFLLPCHEKLLYLVLIKGAISMKLKHLFTFILILQITVFSDAYSAASSPSPEEIFETTVLPGGLVQRVINMPEGSNYFILSHDGGGISLRAGNVEEYGSSLPILYIDESLRHGEGVTIKEEGIFIEAVKVIIDNAGTYKTGKSILLTAPKIQMAQTGFVWGGKNEHCVLSARKDCASPLRSIELIEGEKDSEGNYRALVYGTLDFGATSLKDTFVSAEYLGTPEAFKGGLTVIGAKAIKLIIKGPEA